VHNDAYIGVRSENNTKCVVHDDLGWKNRTARFLIFCCVTGFTSDFFQFHRCETYSILSRSPSVVAMMQHLIAVQTVSSLLGVIAWNEAVPKLLFCFSPNCCTGIHTAQSHVHPLSVLATLTFWTPQSYTQTRMSQDRRVCTNFYDPGFKFQLL